MSPRLCDFSGLAVRDCQASDLCDCFTDGRADEGPQLRPEAFTIILGPDQEDA